MKKYLFGIAATTLFVSSFVASPADAQSSVLAEVYGRGVHAHYAGHTTEAYDLFSMAINNGLDDPRAYYFRGISLYNSGREFEAESDWQQGASLEARGKGSGSIGAALHRFQGSGRLKLEQIRQKARLEYLAEAAARSRARYGEIEAAEPNVLRSAPRPNAVAPPAALAPPPAPPAADENPFADDLGEPAIESDDALADAMDDPFADDGAGAADAGGDAPAADPFGGDGGAVADPFGGGGGADPFGGGGAMDDPFGGDPFGN